MAFGELDDIWLFAHSYGSRIDEIALERIADPGPYVAAAAQT